MGDHRTPSDGARSVTASGRVQSLERALTLLRHVADTSPDGDTLARLADRCGVNRATAWRLLTTLEAHGMVERDPVSHRYSVGFAVTAMAANSGRDGLVRRARATLERLSAQTGETANLALVRGSELTYVDEVAPATVLAAKWLGRSVPLHATSAGKALLAWLPAGDVDTLLAEPLTAYTETTVVDRAHLDADLAATRERGYAVCVGEVEPNLYGVAAPVHGGTRPLAVVSIWGSSDRVAESRFPALGALAATAADEVRDAVLTRTVP